jgi:hypothetical protein
MKNIFLLTLVLILLSSCALVSNVQEIEDVKIENSIKTFKNKGISLQYYSKMPPYCQSDSFSFIAPVYIDNSITFLPINNNCDYFSLTNFSSDFNLDKIKSSSFYTITIDNVDQSNIISFLNSRHGDGCGFKKTILNPSLFDFEDTLSGSRDADIDCDINFGYRYSYNVDTNNLYYMYAGYECIYNDPKYPNICNGIIWDSINFY